MSKIKNTRVLFSILIGISIVFTGCTESYQTSFVLKPGSIKGKIVFVSNREVATRKLYIINADGTNLRSIPTDTNMNDTPIFNRNGTKVIFRGRKNGNSGQIFYVNIDGSNLTQVTPPSKTTACYSPVYSPDKNSIFFFKQEGGDTTYGIYSYNIDSKEEKKIINHIDSASFSVSPDGNFLAYEYPNNNHPDIYLKNLKSGGTINLTKGKGGNFQPSWSPDGERIAFISSRDKKTEVYIMDKSGENVKRITNNVWQEDDPTWSPDGTKILYSSRRNKGSFSGSELFITDLNNAREWQITKAIKNKDSLISSDTHPSWTE